MSILSSNGIPNFGDPDADVLMNLTAPLTTSGFTGTNNFEKVAGYVPPGLTGAAGSAVQQVGYAVGAGAGGFWTGVQSAAAVIAAAGVTGGTAGANSAMTGFFTAWSKAGYLKYRIFGLTYYVPMFASV